MFPGVITTPQKREFPDEYRTNFEATIIPINYTDLCTIECLTNNIGDWMVDWGDGAFIRYDGGTISDTPTGIIRIKNGFSRKIIGIKFISDTFRDIYIDKAEDITSFEEVCKNLTNLEGFHSIGNQLIKSYKNAWFNCPSLVVWEVNKILNANEFTSTFEGCSSLESVTGLKSLGGLYFDNMFKDCISLRCINKINTVNNISTTDMFFNTPELINPDASSKALIETGLDYSNPFPCPILPGVARTIPYNNEIYENNYFEFEFDDIVTVNTGNVTVFNIRDEIIFQQDIGSINFDGIKTFNFTTSIPLEDEYYIVIDRGVVSSIDTSLNDEYTWNFENPYSLDVRIETTNLLDITIDIPTNWEYYDGTSWSATVIGQKTFSISSYSIKIRNLRTTQANTFKLISPNILEVDILSGDHLTSLNSSFMNLNKLETFKSTDLLITDYTSTFEGCSALSNLPLFNNSQGLMFNNMFKDCVNLVCIKDINTTSQTSTTDMFFNTPNLFNPTASEQTQIEAGFNYVNSSLCPGINFDIDLYGFDTNQEITFTISDWSYIVWDGIQEEYLSPGTYTRNVVDRGIPIRVYSFENFNNISFDNNNFRRIVLNKGNTLISFSCYGLTRLEQVDYYNDTNTKITSYEDSFRNCSNLDNITFYTNDAIIKSYKNTFNNCSSLLTYNWPRSHSIDTDFTSMFKDCIALTSVQGFSTGTNGIIDSLFEGCSNITFSDIYYGDTCISAKRVFANCILLEQVREINTIGALTTDLFLNTPKLKYPTELERRTILEGARYISASSSIGDSDTTVMTFQVATGITSIDITSSGGDSAITSYNSSLPLPEGETVTVPVNEYNYYFVESLYNVSFGFKSNGVRLCHMFRGTSDIGLKDNTSLEYFESNYNEYLPTHLFHSFENSGLVEMTSINLTQLNTTITPPLENTWAGCSNLSSMPLVEIKVASGPNLNLVSTWQGCTSLTSFPVLDLSEVGLLRDTWMGCSGLTTFPNLDYNNITDMIGAWAECSNLETMEGMSNTINNGSLFRCWENCTSLTHMPTIDTTNVGSFWLTWSGCTNLACLTNIDTRNQVTTTDMFLNCSSLSSPDASEQITIGNGAYWVNDGTCPIYPPKFVGNIDDINTNIDDIISIDINNTFTNTTSYALTNAPTWMTIDSNGVIGGTASIIEDVFNIQVKGMNNDGFALSNFFNSSVSQIPPTFVGNINNISINNNTSISIDISNTFKNVSSYALTNAPTWMTIDSNGVIGGTSDSIGLTTGITVIGTNEIGNVSSNVFYTDVTTVTLDITLKRVPTESLCSINILGTCLINGIEYTTGTHAITLTSTPMTITNDGTLGENLSRIRIQTDSIEEIDIIEGGQLTSMESLCYNLQNLKVFNANNTQNVVDFGYAWFQCNSLTSFPSIDTSQGTSFYASWLNCSGLTSFGSINTSNATLFGDAWRGCFNLTCLTNVDTSLTTTPSNTANMFLDTPSLTAPNASDQAAIEAGMNWTNPGSCP